MKDFLSIPDIQRLEKLHRKCRKRRLADRIKTILLLNKGYTFEEIAEILLLDDSTLRKYYSIYLQLGIDKLLSEGYSGTNKMLDDEQVRRLKIYLKNRLFQTSKQIRDFIEAKYYVCYSVNGVSNLLHSIGFVYKKLKHTPGKADLEKQLGFIDEYKKLKLNKNKEDKIYFVDGCHPVHNSIPSYCWIEKGAEKQLKANTGRKRININGALDIEEKNVVIREDQSINSDSTIQLFEQLSNRQKAGLIYIICDNARYYRSKKVTEYLSENNRVRIIFLPPYSPNLNIIERLWLFFKKQVLHNKHYEKFDVFKKVALDFFERIDLYEKELNSLLTDNFQIIDPNFSKIYLG